VVGPRGGANGEEGFAQDQGRDQSGGLGPEAADGQHPQIRQRQQPQDPPPDAEGRGSGTIGSGYGLGLAIVRSVALAHGGRCDATPRPDGGLAVTITLPNSAA
jgi:hypothetical protein